MDAPEPINVGTPQYNSSTGLLRGNSVFRRSPRLMNPDDEGVELS